MVVQALVVQLGAKECLATPEPSNPDAVKMYKLLERSGMMVTDRKKGACVTIVLRRYDEAVQWLWLCHDRALAI
jgi:hypothetical protein